MNNVQWQNFVETLFGWRTYWTLWQNGYLNNRFFEHWWNSIIIDNSFCQSLIEINIFCHCISQLSSIQTLCTIFSRNECKFWNCHFLLFNIKITYFIALQNFRTAEEDSKFSERDQSTETYLQKENTR